MRPARYFIKRKKESTQAGTAAKNKKPSKPGGGVPPIGSEGFKVCSGEGRG